MFGEFMIVQSIINLNYMSDLVLEPQHRYTLGYAQVIVVFLTCIVYLALIGKDIFHNCSLKA